MRLIEKSPEDGFATFTNESCTIIWPREYNRIRQIDNHKRKKKIVFYCCLIIYKIECFIDASATNKSDNLTCVIIQNNLTCRLS